MAAVEANLQAEIAALSSKYNAKINAINNELMRREIRAVENAVRCCFNTVAIVFPLAPTLAASLLHSLAGRLLAIVHLLEA